MNVTRIVASLVAVGLVAGSAMAQTAAPAAGSANGVLLTKGSVLLGGNIGWTLSNNGGERDTKWSTLAVAPEINYFFMDNLSIGLISSITWRRYVQDGYTGNYTDLMGELVARYYVPACNNRIIPYVGATAGGGFSKSTWKGASWEDDRQNTLTTYGVQAGFLVPLTESVMLDTRLSYKRTNTNGDRNDEIDQIGWDHDLPNDRNDVTMQMGILVKL